jgi:hypothetical protein
MSKRPTLMVAVLCQLVLEEQGGTVLSLIRLVNKFFHDGTRPLRLTRMLFLMFAPADDRADFSVSLWVIAPSGKEMSGNQNVPFTFPAGTTASSASVAYTLELNENGWYSIEVRDGADVVARIPFEVGVGRPTPTH